MTNISIIILSTLYLAMGFLGLLTHRLSYKIYISEFMFLATFYTFFSDFGQWVTFPLVFISISIVYWGSNRNIWCAIQSLTGYLIVTLVNHLITIPLSLVGVSIDTVAEHYYIPFLITCCVITATLLFFIRKVFMSPKMIFLQECPPKIQYVFLTQLLLCILLLGINFIYGDSVGYPAEVLGFNGLLISVFALFTLVLFYFLYQLLQEINELKIKQREQELMADYTRRIESFYEEFRVFRHDYKNILSTLHHFILVNDMDGLKHYFEEFILPAGAVLTSDNHILTKLYLVEIPSIKSMLYTKLITAINKGMSITLELTEPLKEIAVDEMDFSRILGIILDNSIEAALLTKEKELSIAIVCTKKSVVFSFSNSCLPIKVPLSKLHEKGYTTKEDHDGLGLYTVQTITDATPNMSYVVKYDGQFKQTLELFR